MAGFSFFLSSFISCNKWQRHDKDDEGDESDEGNEDDDDDTKKKEKSRWNLLNGMFWNLTIQLVRYDKLKCTCKVRQCGPCDGCREHYKQHFVCECCRWHAGIWLDVYLIEKNCSFRVVNTCKMFIKKIKALSRTHIPQRTRFLQFSGIFSMSTQCCSCMCNWVVAFARETHFIWYNATHSCFVGRFSLRRTTNEFSVIIITVQYFVVIKLVFPFVPLFIASLSVPVFW